MLSWLQPGGVDPAAWAFFGAVISGLVLILIEQIRGRRETRGVKREVVDSKDAAAIALDTLAADVKQLNIRMNEHIKWHLEDRKYIYLDRR